MNTLAHTDLPGRQETATAPVLALTGVTKRFGGTPAVSDLSFTVERGEFFTLLGPSGCGKSTTLMMIAGFERPDAGTIALDGEDVTHAVPERRGMGVVFQSYALFPHLSVLDNVAFPLKMRGLGRRERIARAAAALHTVDLRDGHHEQRPAQLSGGQQQRVALARAIVFDPQILLMDEPLAALDRQLRQGLQFELRRLQTRLDTTVLYVTHDQEEALVLSDRIAVMRDGSFEQLANPTTLYQEPVNGFVATFLGSSNAVAGAIAERDGRRVFRSGDDVEWDGAIADTLAAGDEAMLVIRPERLTVQRDHDRQGAFRTELLVEDIAFLGDHLRVEGRVAGAADHWTISVSPFGDQPPRVGQTLTVAAPREAVRVIPC